MVVSPGRSSTENTCLRHEAADSGTAAAAGGFCGARVGGAAVAAGADAAAGTLVAAAAAAGTGAEEEGAATRPSMPIWEELGSHCIRSRGLGFFLGVCVGGGGRTVKRGTESLGLGGSGGRGSWGASEYSTSDR
jgi:hypothetical protein